MKQDAKLTPVHPWEFPEGPWRRLHIDFAGPFEGKMFMVVIDAFSKWPEVAIMERTTTEDTIEKLRDMFARWGIPTQIVSDNGPQFTSEMFVRFTRANNIKHTTTSPYHPATNGLAERFVQTLKQALRVSRKDGRTLNGRLNNFLISYRNARHSTTERTPAQLLIGRDLRSRLHLLKPNLRDTVLRNQTRQIQTRSTATEREFGIGEHVMVRDYRPSSMSKWRLATVKARIGPKTYYVEVGGGGVWKRHSDQIRRGGCMEANARQEGGDEQDLENREAAQECLPEETPFSVRHPNVNTPILPSLIPRQLESPPSSISLSNPQQPAQGMARELPSEPLGVTPSHSPNCVPQTTVEILDPTKSASSAGPRSQGNLETPKPVVTRYGRIIKKPSRYREDTK